jgi:divalent metal cation (Fe/Co/Zn/Cd) transporter
MEIADNPEHRKILILEYLTIAWNVVEGIVAVSIGIMSGSISLLAFGLESGIEVFSSSVTVWEIKGPGNGRRKLALKLISFAFIAVAIYITITAVSSFYNHKHPEPTMIGILYMFLVSIIMSVLGYQKRIQGLKLNNPVILAEANFTLMDVALSSSVLIGLILNYWLDWSWVDQFLALVIAANAFYHGIKGLKNNSRIKMN